MFLARKADMDAWNAPEMTINLKIIKTIELGVNGTDTIEDVKTKVYRAEGVPVDQQRMFFASRLLTDAKTLAYYNVCDKSTIDLYVGDGIDVFVKFPSKENEISFSVKKSDTVHTLKFKIQDQEGIPLMQQALIYMGRPLEDNWTLTSCGIGDHARLILMVRPVDDLCILINIPLGKTLALEVKSWYTIENVKVVIQSLEGLPSHLLKLTYNGRELEDALTLYDHKIRNNYMLEVLPPPVQVLVKTWNSSKTLILMVEQTDTMSMVMDKIENKLQFKRNQQHALSYAGKILQGDKTVAHYRIQANSTIHLIAPRFYNEDVEAMHNFLSVKRFGEKEKRGPVIF